MSKRQRRRLQERRSLHIDQRGRQPGSEPARHPSRHFRASGNYSPAAGPTGGVQYSVTNQLFNVTDQAKLAVRIPIPLPNPSQTLPADANGGSDVITQTGGEGPPAITATRDVSSMGYPDGNGNTVTVNPDGSYTVHSPTGEATRSVRSTPSGRAARQRQRRHADPPAAPASAPTSSSGRATTG